MEDDGIFLEFAYLSGSLVRRDTVCSSLRSVAPSHTDSGRVSRADTELEAGGKLTGRDKAVLSWIWLLSLVYGVMCLNILSKVVDRPCDVREPLDHILGILSLLFGLILPFILGNCIR